MDDDCQASFIRAFLIDLLQFVIELLGAMESAWSWRAPTFPWPTASDALVFAGPAGNVIRTLFRVSIPIRKYAIAVGITKGAIPLIHRTVL